MDEQKKIQSQWSIRKDSFKPAKSELEIEEIESDLKKTEDWQTYYERMYEKTGNEKYDKKFKKAVDERVKLEDDLDEGIAGLNKDEFEKTFMDAMEKRIIKDMTEDMENNIRGE